MVALHCALTAEQVYAEMNWEILHRACALLTKRINRQIKQEKEKMKVYKAENWPQEKMIGHYLLK